MYSRIEATLLLFLAAFTGAASATYHVNQVWKTWAISKGYGYYNTFTGIIEYRPDISIPPLPPPSIITPGNTFPGLDELFTQVDNE